jgi:hypothetical protein
MLVLASAVILRSESRGTHDHILLSQIGDFRNLEGQVPVFISPRNRVAQLYPQVLGSLFFASYYSQGYGGSIRPRLHTRIELSSKLVPLITLRHGQHRKQLFCCTGVYVALLRSNGPCADYRKTPLLAVPLLCVDSLPWEPVCDRYLITRLHATVRFWSVKNI